MDFRAGLILVCMLFARASCQPVGNNSREKTLSTIEQIRTEIEIALNYLSSPTLLPTNLNCTLNTTELENQKNFNDQISTFSCYTQKFSALVSSVSEQLNMITQFMEDIKHQRQDKTDPMNCSVPDHKEELVDANNAKCFLLLVQKKLTNPKL